MQQKNPAANFFTDMQSTMKQMMDSVPATNPFDLKAVLEAQRKNIQALTEANQCAMAGWQNLAKRQAEMVSEFVQGNSSLATNSFSPRAPQDTIAKQAEIVKTVCEQSLQNTRELTEIVRKNAADTAEVISRRVAASIGEIKNTGNRNADK